MSKLNLSHWLTKEQAATELGVHIKTVERLTARGRIQMQIWKRPKGAAIAVFHPRDVAREKAKRNTNAPAAFVLPPEPQNAVALQNPLDLAISHGSDSPHTKEILTYPQKSMEIQPLSVSETSKTGRARGPEVPIDRRLFLTRSEAASYAGLPKSCIQAAMNAGLLRWIRTGRGIRIVRETLEPTDLADFLEHQVSSEPRQNPFIGRLEGQEHKDTGPGEDKQPEPRDGVIPPKG